MKVTIYKHVPKGKLSNILMNGLYAGELVSTGIPNVNEGWIAQFKVDKNLLKRDGELFVLKQDVPSNQLESHWNAKR